MTGGTEPSDAGHGDDAAPPSRETGRLRLTVVSALGLMGGCPPGV
jgi:hypothetical protein